jgi:hypothetical protein
LLTHFFMTYGFRYSTANLTWEFWRENLDDSEERRRCHSSQPSGRQ